MRFPTTIPISYGAVILAVGMYFGRNEIRLARAEEKFSIQENIYKELNELNKKVDAMQNDLNAKLSILRQDTESTRKELQRRRQ